MSVNVSSQFTKDEKIYDGLAAIEKQLIEEPLTRHLIVATIETSSINHSVRKGTITPTVRLVEVEVIADDGDTKTAQAMLRARHTERTGRSVAPQDPLPFDDGPTSERTPDEWLDDGSKPKKKG